jgi:hypothetical protein
LETQGLEELGKATHGGKLTPDTVGFLLPPLSSVCLSSS